MVDISSPATSHHH